MSIEASGIQLIAEDRKFESNKAQNMYIYYLVWCALRLGECSTKATRLFANCLFKRHFCMALDRELNRALLVPSYTYIIKLLCVLLSRSTLLIAL